MKDYQEFLSSKVELVKPVGFHASPESINPTLFAFQSDITRWALSKGRSAIFADTGLGKTFMQVEWARVIGKRCLIVAPLGVAKQTVREAKKLGVEVNYTRDKGLVSDGVNITNYEMVEHFDPKAFDAVVLDESSILKSLDGKTRRRLTEMFSEAPFRLCCTATPCPNDIAEIANHAEFLGVMKRQDMMAKFFVHDDEGWRLKGHAQEPFFRWLASWSMSLSKPSDLGYSDDGFILPPLEVTTSWVDGDVKAPDGQLFWTGGDGIRGRLHARRSTVTERCHAAADLIGRDENQWLIWCSLNDEGREIQKMIPGAALLEGQMDAEVKERTILDFQDGKIRVLITKPKISGFGMNLQNCHKMIFLGLTDSWESYYQCVRRCYRFGQKKPVQVFIVLATQQSEVLENVMRKNKEAQCLRESLLEHTKAYEVKEIRSEANPHLEYQTADASGDNWKMMLGDSCERMKEIADDSVGLSVFSPPFISLYTYSPTERDIGNSRTAEEFLGHFRFIMRELLRATMPGRNCCVHVAQVPAMLVRDGYIGLKDFRGRTIQEFEQEGWVYHGEVCIDKDPQAQAIRTKSKALLFVQMRRDASWLRPALADYILVFRKPGENKSPVLPDITNNQWIEWARPIWYGIEETDTLNYTTARENSDERHICPLQLGTIERCIKLWSNATDLVVSPFAGIGSEGHVAIKNERRFIGIELKRTYYESAVKNLKRCEDDTKAYSLFRGVADVVE